MNIKSNKILLLLQKLNLEYGKTRPKVTILSKKNTNIIIKGASEHNLKNVDVEIPKYELSVVSGVSGSGKSSLCISTLYAEGQRRYAESLSAYSRQFIAQMKKPKVKYIQNICPAIALEQKTNTHSSRSTVATLSGIYDYLKILYAKLGKTFSPISGNEVKEDSDYDILSFIKSINSDKNITILAPIKETLSKSLLEMYLSKGITRIFSEGKYLKSESLLNSKKPVCLNQPYVVFNRFRSDNLSMGLSESIKQAFLEGDGDLTVLVENESFNFSNRFELDGISFEKPSQYLFSFSSPYGACPSCQGYGSILGIDHDLVIPDKSLSIYDNTVACWRGEKMIKWKQDFISKARHKDFPIFRSYSELRNSELDILWNGDGDIKGINDFFKKIEEKSYKIQYRVLLSRYRGKTSCLECRGSRLRKETQYVKINGQSMTDLLNLNLKEVARFFKSLKLKNKESKVGDNLITAILERLNTLNKLGLHYLSLSRDSRTLSGGETQRINLSKFLSSPLVDALYILDEPSIGLHPRDTKALIDVLKDLTKKQNTVLLVEHDEDIILASDYIVDMGPKAGELGGNVVYAGPTSELSSCEKSLTAQYISGKASIPVPKKRRISDSFIKIKCATENNIKNLNINIPLNNIVAISGVSGSGKTTLVNKIIYQNLDRLINQGTTLTKNCKQIIYPDGDLVKVEFIDQNPIGKSSRSNPITYIKAYDSIRKLLAAQTLAKMNGFTSSQFSFNSEGGRCPTCKGDGLITIEMQFLPDVSLKCDDCQGQRFKNQVLEVRYKEHNIYDILQLSVDEALVVFKEEKDVYKRLEPLQKVGLGYIRLGQTSNSLSGGEAQRVKLASFLGNINNTDACLFIFDEPTTGLHTHDIIKLYNTFNLLIENGHSIILVEHNLEMLKLSDWIVDLGPDGGDKGGKIVYQGPPEEIKKAKTSFTSKYLIRKLN